MNALSEPFRKFVAKVGGVKVLYEIPVSPTRRYIADLYDLSVARIGDTKIGIVYVKDPKHFTPGIFQKHYASIEPDFGENTPYVVVAKVLSSHVKTRLFEKEIPFVLPGVQMSWPAIGAYHRHRALPSPVEPKETIAPAAQLVVIAFLCDKLPTSRTAAALGRHFGYTPMTMSRAVREIQAVGSASLRHRGHGRELQFEEGKATVWETFKGRMRSPVARSLHVELSSLSRAEVNTLMAGETALAERSMLSPSSEEMLASKNISNNELKKQNLVEVPPFPKETCELQLWSYDPWITSRDGQVVDPFSLWLSLKDVDDPRVSEALESMMESIDWS